MRADQRILSRTGIGTGGGYLTSLADMMGRVVRVSVEYKF